jgi:hypothetical protein
MSGRVGGRPLPGRKPRGQVFRVGGISYLRIPAENPRLVAAFYEAVFDWALRGDPDDPSFEDGTGHVIGHFMADLPVAGGRRAAVRSTSGVSTTRSTRSPRTAVRSSRHRIPRAIFGWLRSVTLPGTCSVCGNTARLQRPSDAVSTLRA